MSVYTDKKSGRLFIQFDYKGRTYKRHLPAETTKTDAKKLETKWKNDLLFETFGFQKKKDALYEDFLTEQFLPFAETHYSDDGYKNVVVITKASLKFLKGKMLRSIAPADVEKFRNDRQKLPTKHDTTRKPATIHREMNIISKVFSYAAKLDYLDFNPCAKVDLPRVSNIQNKVLPVDKLQSFLDNFNSAWARDVTILILNTGLRQNDALGLKKSEADFDKRIITLIQGKSKREVILPMNEIVYQLLTARKDNGSDLFFPSPRGGGKGKSIKKGLLAAANAVGLGNVGTRVLRRTFGTQLAELNFNPSAIAKLLGHSDLKTVHRYERETSILRDAVKALENVNPTHSLPKAKKRKTKKQ